MEEGVIFVKKLAELCENVLKLDMPDNEREKIKGNINDIASICGESYGKLEAYRAIVKSWGMDLEK